jgi:hypothetical protein
MQPMLIRKIVLLTEKTRISIVAALHDMQRHAREVNSRAAGHGRSLL